MSSEYSTYPFMTPTTYLCTNPSNEDSPSFVLPQIQPSCSYPSFPWSGLPSLDTVGQTSSSYLQTLLCLKYDLV